MLYEVITPVRVLGPGPRAVPHDDPLEAGVETVVAGSGQRRLWYELDGSYNFV